ncbi:MAG: low molecular weight protein-tyrosine-phosphatase [Vulcanimicrobiota bacterium]
MVRVCFVCLGNICRSPTAEGVLLHLVREGGFQDQVLVDSAGTASYHIGNRADQRSARAARRRGFELPSRARQFTEDDFDRFDYVLAMDDDNLASLRSLSGGHHHKLHLLLDFDDSNPKGSSVPDPYYGGDHGFEHVLDLCTAACQKFLEFLVKEHGLVAE